MIRTEAELGYQEFHPRSLTNVNNGFEYASPWNDQWRGDITVRKTDRRKFPCEIEVGMGFQF